MKAPSGNSQDAMDCSRWPHLQSTEGDMWEDGERSEYCLSSLSQTPSKKFKAREQRKPDCLHLGMTNKKAISLSGLSLSWSLSLTSKEIQQRTGQTCQPRGALPSKRPRKGKILEWLFGVTACTSQKDPSDNAAQSRNQVTAGRPPCHTCIAGWSTLASQPGQL